MVIKKQIGFMTALSLVMGIVIGGGILVLPSVVAQYGKWGFWAWPIASLAVLNLAFMFGQLSRKNPQGSGPASFAHTYFGNVMGFQIAWAHAIGLSMGTAVVSISFAGYLSSVIGMNSFTGLWVSLGALWSIVLLKALFTLISLRTLVIITMLKIITLSTIICFGMSSTSSDIMFASPINASFDGFSGLFGALALVLFAFIGIEGATLPGENVKNAHKTIPLATILGTVFSAILFTGTYAIVCSVVPIEVLLKSSAPVANAAGILMGPWGVKCISILAMIGCLGSINGCVFATSHILRGSAESGWLPAVFKKMTSAAFPIAGGLSCGLLSSVVIVIYYMVDDIFAPIVRNNAAQLEVFLVSIVYLVSCMAYKLSGGNKFMWIVGIISCIGFLFGSMDDYFSACLGIMTFMSGIIIYTAFAHKMQKLK